MTTDLERRLRVALHADAARARLANPNRPPTAEMMLLLSNSPRRARSGRRLAAVAATVALTAAAGVVLVHNGRERAPDVTTSPDRTPLFTDIPPGSTVPLPAAP